MVLEALMQLWNLLWLGSIQTVALRKIERTELAQMQAIGRQTISETFAAGAAELILKKYLAKRFSLQN